MQSVTSDTWLRLSFTRVLALPNPAWLACRGSERHHRQHGDNEREVELHDRRSKWSLLRKGLCERVECEVVDGDDEVFEGCETLWARQERSEEWEK